MIQDNIRVAHALLEAFEHRDLDALIELTDPLVDWHSLFAHGVDFKGHDGMHKYVKDLNDAWDTVRLDVEHEFGAGDLVLFIGRVHYRGKGSGVEDNRDSGCVLKLREGRVLSFRPFQDPYQALETVGLSE